MSAYVHNYMLTSPKFGKRTPCAHAAQHGLLHFTPLLVHRHSLKHSFPKFRKCVGAFSTQFYGACAHQCNERKLLANKSEPYLSACVYPAAARPVGCFPSGLQIPLTRHLLDTKIKDLSSCGVFAYFSHSPPHCKHGRGTLSAESNNAQASRAYSGTRDGI